MKKDSAEKKVYSIKKLGKIMGYVLLGTAFLISFLFIDKNINRLIVVAVLGSAIVVEVIIWIILYFVFKKKNETENDKNIAKAIKAVEQEEQTTDEQKENESQLDSKPDPTGVVNKPVDIQG